MPNLYFPGNTFSDKPLPSDLSRRKDVELLADKLHGFAVLGCGYQVRG
ncbi:MAG: hypothetical protein ACKVQU_19335 [Burkholderiales bacterium]